MCKPRRAEQRDAAPATGPTTRLSHAESIEAAQYAPPRGPLNFPWWTLWLIWPLIGLAKAVAPALLGAVGALSQWTVPLLPLLLIGLGLLLLAHWRNP